MQPAPVAPVACPFCLIVRGEAAADVVYRDERVVAFRDARPVAPIHILIIPVRHFDSLQDVGEAAGGLLYHMAEVAARMAESENVAASGYRLVINTGRDAGQSVFHLHVHLLAGRRLHWPPG